VTLADDLAPLARAAMPWRCRAGFHRIEIATNEQLAGMGLSALLPLFYCTRCGRAAMWGQSPWVPVERLAPIAESALAINLASGKARVNPLRGARL
jgi:hypothetical protein